MRPAAGADSFMVVRPGELAADLPVTDYARMPTPDAPADRVAQVGSVTWPEKSTRPESRWRMR